MNNTIQYVGALTPTSSGTAVAGEVPLKVPEGRAFRVRFVEFRAGPGGAASDYDLNVALSKVNQETIRIAAEGFNSQNTYLAYWSFSIEITTSGAYFSRLSKRFDLWDYDYRLVMPPTFHTLQFVETRLVHCVLGGEMVSASQGQRNAIIAFQGGLH